MKMLMWRRIAGVESQSRSRMPGQRCVELAIISSTVETDISTERVEPGKRSTRTPGSLTVTAAFAALIASEPIALIVLDDSVSTDEIVGRCSAIGIQLSPSSALANSVPVLVPK